MFDGSAMPYGDPYHIVKTEITDSNRTVMGIEYQIAISPLHRHTVDDILRCAPYFAETADQFGDLKYEFRLPDNTGTIPNAYATIEPYGVYFCDFGGAHEIMKTIVQHITDRIAAPSVSELE